MTITYSWEVTGMRTKTVGNTPNVVVQVFWKKTGTDETGNSSSFIGSTPFNTESIDPENFIPFDNLTEENVLNWVKQTITASFEEHINTIIEKQIQENSNPPVDAVLPWKPQN